jgi:hypothetical protein
MTNASVLKRTKLRIDRQNLPRFTAMGPALNLLSHSGLPESASLKNVPKPALGLQA